MWGRWARRDRVWALCLLVTGCGRLAYEEVGRTEPRVDATLGCATGDCDSGTDACSGAGGRPTTVGLVLHWKLDEASGGVAFDSTANGIDGTPTGHVWHPESGVIGGAIEVPAGSAGPDAFSGILDAIDDRMTFAVWFRDSGSPTDNYRNVISKIDFAATPKEGWAVTIIGGTTDMHMRLDTSRDQNQTEGIFPDVVDGEWHHIAFTLDAGMFATYLDGVQTQTAGYNHHDGFGGPGEFILGTDRDIAALFDDARYYSRALSAEEIAAMLPVTGCAD